MQEVAEIAGEQRQFAGDRARVPSRPGRLAGFRLAGHAPSSHGGAKIRKPLHHLARFEPLIVPSPAGGEKHQPAHQRHGQEFDNRRRSHANSWERAAPATKKAAKAVTAELAMKRER